MYNESFAHISDAISMFSFVHCCANYDSTQELQEILLFLYILFVYVCVEQKKKQIKIRTHEEIKMIMWQTKGVA